MRKVISTFVGSILCILNLMTAIPVIKCQCEGEEDGGSIPCPTSPEVTTLGTTTIEPTTASSNEVATASTTSVSSTKANTLEISWTETSISSAISDEDGTSTAIPVEISTQSESSGVHLDEEETSGTTPFEITAQSANSTGETTRGTTWVSTPRIDTDDDETSGTTPVEISTQSANSTKENTQGPTWVETGTPHLYFTEPSQTADTLTTTTAEEPNGLSLGTWIGIGIVAAAVSTAVVGLLVKGILHLRNAADVSYSGEDGRNMEQSANYAFEMTGENPTKMSDRFSTFDPAKKHPYPKAHLTSHDLEQTEVYSLARVAELKTDMEFRIKKLSIKCKSIDMRGGYLENSGCKITFPPASFAMATMVKMSVITDLSDCPEGCLPIAPIIECSPPGKLNRPALLEVEPWIVPTGRRELYATVLRKDVPSLEWYSVGKIHVERDKKLVYWTEHFTLFEFVMDFSTWAWAGITRPFFQITFQNLVYISGIDHRIACVSCLRNDKVLNDVTQALTNAGYRPLLPLPQIARTRRGGEIMVTLGCIDPENLEILVRDNVRENFRSAREIRKTFPANIILRNCQESRYFSMRMRGGNLKRYDGLLQLSYALASGEDNIQHHLQIVWPIPGAPVAH